MDTLAIMAVIKAASETLAIGVKALEAAQNDDADAAEEYLAQARDHYAQSSAAWDAAPGPG